MSESGVHTEQTERLHEDIAQTREELGETVEALAAKADVKAQARAKFDQMKASATEKKEQLLGKATDASPGTAASAASQVTQKAKQNPVPLAAAGVFAVGFLAGRLTKR
jgi:chromosome segregation ATPase